MTIQVDSVIDFHINQTPTCNFLSDALY